MLYLKVVLTSISAVFIIIISCVVFFFFFFWSCRVLRDDDDEEYESVRSAPAKLQPTNCRRKDRAMTARG